MKKKKQPHKALFCDCENRDPNKKLASALLLWTLNRKGQKPN